METKVFNVSSSPHFKSKVSTSTLMRDVVIAMIPSAAWGVYRFGINSLIVIIATVAACVLSEFIWEKCMKKPVTICDFSAVVTGMILALNMPPQVPFWVPVIGGVFAIIFVKQLYGGLGQNFMNPALAARCFLLISFAGMVNDFTAPAIGFDALTGATPLALVGQSPEGLQAALSQYSYADLFLGNVPGTIGEVSKLCLLIGAAYLVVRKVITLHVPLAYIGTFAVFTFLFKGFNAQYVLYELLSGGLIFGAFFMATDYVTRPLTFKGQIVYGVLMGILLGVFRLFGASPEGCSYSIILGNLFVPLIERYTLPTAFGKEAKK